MAAQDKLIPIAIIFARSLQGTKGSTNSFAMPYGAIASNYRNPYTDTVQFFGSMYAKELKIAGGDATWNYQMVDGTNLTALYTANRNTHSLTLGTLIAASEAEWNELQLAIARSFNIVYPFDIAGPWTAPEILAYNNLMGVIDNGIVTPAPLVGADASPLGNFAQGTVYADAWNTIKVPYDQSIGIVTPFIAPIFKPTGATKFYYRYTGNRRWFGFQGYNIT